MASIHNLAGEIRPYEKDGRLLADCPSCGQAGSVTRRPGGRLVFDCFARCGNGSGIYSEASANGEDRVSTLRDFTEIVARPVRWGWQDRIALGKITALAGRPKVGKGLLYSQLIAAVTRGTLDGDLPGPRDAIVVTTRGRSLRHAQAAFMAANADLTRVSEFRMGTHEAPVPFRVPQDAEELRRRVEERNTGLVVIDPLVEFVDGKLDSHKSQPVRQAIAALNEIARSTACAVLVIFHLNKGTSSDPLLRHEGSAAFTQVVRGGLMLGHDPDDPDGDEGSRRVLAVSASNLAGIAPSLVYAITTATVIGDTGEEIKTARMAVVGESGAAAHDLLRGQPDEEEQTGTDEAEGLLSEELADGPRSAEEILKQVRRLGISDKQLRRARGRLGVESKKTGFRGGWEWSLPKAPQGAPRRPEDALLREEGRLGRLRDEQRDCEVPEGAQDAQGAPLDDGAPSWSSTLDGDNAPVVCPTCGEELVEGINSLWCLRCARAPA